MVKIDKEEGFDCSDYETKKILMTMPKEDIIDRYFYRFNRVITFLSILVWVSLIGGGFFGYAMGDSGIDKEIKELGQSICEEEYDMEFKSYNDKELKCKDKEIEYEEQYDGITIQIE